MICEIEKLFRFESAHWLPFVSVGHQCHRVHGHSYVVAVMLRGVVDPGTGFVVDFGDVSEVWRLACGGLDHRTLNDVGGLENPTAEILAVWIFERMASQLPVIGVTVRETCTAAATYRGEA